MIQEPRFKVETNKLSSHPLSCQTYSIWDNKYKKYIPLNPRGRTHDSGLPNIELYCNKLNEIHETSYSIPSLEHMTTEPRYELKLYNHTQPMLVVPTHIKFYGVWDTQEHKFIEFWHSYFIIKSSHDSQLISEYVQVFNT